MFIPTPPLLSDTESSRSLLAAGRLGGLVGLGRMARDRAIEAERAYPPLGDIMDVDGTPVSFLRMGSGPAVILVHGAGGNLRDFTFGLAAKMARTNTVIAFDRPGHGYTGCLHRRGESPAEQAWLLHRAALRLGVGRAILAGYSYGGAVGLAWALMAPEFTAGLMLLAAASHPWPGGVGMVFGAAAAYLTAPLVVPVIAARAPESLVHDTIRSVFRPHTPPEGYLDYIGVPLSLRAHCVRANARQVVGLKPHVAAMARSYARLTMPAEILHGTADRTVYAALQSEMLAHAMPNARYTRLRRVGHSPHHHAHEAVLAALGRLNALH